MEPDGTGETFLRRDAVLFRRIDGAEATADEDAAAGSGEKHTDRET